MLSPPILLGAIHLDGQVLKHICGNLGRMDPLYRPDPKTRRRDRLPGEFPLRADSSRRCTGAALDDAAIRRIRFCSRNKSPIQIPSRQRADGASVAFDLPTQMGMDSDHPLAAGEVGKVGVSIDTLRDMETVFDGIPLDRVSTSMTINATAAILLAMYIAVAKKQGVSPKTLMERFKTIS